MSDEGWLTEGYGGADEQLTHQLHPRKFWTLNLSI
jgi:hypothetical protein